MGLGDFLRALGLLPAKGKARRPAPARAKAAADDDGGKWVVHDPDPAPAPPGFVRWPRLGKVKVAGVSHYEDDARAVVRAAMRGLRPVRVEARRRPDHPSGPHVVEVWAAAGDDSLRQIGHLEDEAARTAAAEAPIDTPLALRLVQCGHTRDGTRVFLHVALLRPGKRAKGTPPGSS